MNCYAVWLKTPNRQLRVFAYEPFKEDDWKRAETLALDFAKQNHNAGYPCIVELFNLSDVGKQVFDTEPQS